jgi:protoporphyrinogen oxidase
LGRVQFFHNWHPSLVANPGYGWLGLEYFCNEDDDLWSMQDSELLRLGTNELEKVGLLHRIKILDGTVIRQVKAYPGYFGSYDQFI